MVAGMDDPVNPMVTLAYPGTAAVSMELTLIMRELSVPEKYGVLCS